MRRLRAQFRNRTGLASPGLILVWLALGVGLIWLGWMMGLAGIESSSGVVKTVTTEPQYGTHVTIDSSPIDFFFDSIDFPSLPDVRVGDHVDLLTRPQPEGWSVAIQSQRGTWIDTIYGDEVAPYTPQTWPIHEIIRWSALALGILVALFGVASLVRWIPSAQSHPASESIRVGPESGSRGEEEEPQATDAPSLPVVQGPEEQSIPPSNRAAIGVWVGAVTVITLPILELIAVIATLGGCSDYASKNLLLIAISVLLAAGGISTLILASRGPTGSPQRTVARRLGIVAVIMAVVSIPPNLFIIGLTIFCAVG